MTAVLKRCAALLVATTVTACLDESRLNERCEWRGDSAFALTLGNAAHRDHLTNDAQIAEANGIRYGDSFRDSVSVTESIGMRADCTTRLFAAITANHGVDSTTIRAAAWRRNLLFDGATMWLPAFVALGVGGVYVARRVCRSWNDDADRVPRLLSLVALTPVVAAVFIGLAQMWSWLVETARFRDAHMSYRVGRLYTSRYGWYFFAAAALVFLALAILAYRRSLTFKAAKTRAADGWRR